MKFGYLLNNGSIAFIPDPVFDVLSWKEVLNKYNITASWFTSSLFNVFIDLDPYLFSKISNVFVGGEALSRGHVLKALSVNPNTNFLMAMDRQKIQHLLRHIRYQQIIVKDQQFQLEAY